MHTHEAPACLPAYAPVSCPRCLAAFEPDPHRSSVMHKCRAKLLEPLSGLLNTHHFPGLSRSIDLEVAHVYREIVDIKDGAGRKDAKVRGCGCVCGGGTGRQGVVVPVARVNLSPPTCLIKPTCLPANVYAYMGRG